jgi:hypothetical protein
MAKKSDKVPTLRVHQMRGAALKALGLVTAPDPEAAVKIAIEQFKVRPEFQNRLAARPYPQ